MKHEEQKLADAHKDLIQSLEANPFTPLHESVHYFRMKIRNINFNEVYQRCADCFKPIGDGTTYCKGCYDKVRFKFTKKNNSEKYLNADGATRPHKTKAA